MTSSLDKAARGNQTTSYSKLLQLIKELDLDAAGNIKTTTKNLKKINEVRAAVNTIILNDTYKSKVETYNNRYDGIESINEDYFSALSSSFSAGKGSYNAIKTVAIDRARESLLRSGIQDQVVEQAVEIVRMNIVSGGRFADLQKQLRLFILGDEERLGHLERYIKQISRDAVNQYSANYIQVVSEDLGLVFYKYIGTNKDTSRQFCKERTGGYFHIDEIEEWGAGKRTDPKFKEPSGGTWPGRIPGTTESNILTFRGGYQCDDKFIPVDTSAVPKKWINRAENLGFFKEEES